MTKGKKRIKGEPAIYDETKERISLTLTPTAKKGLENIAKELGINKSELIERIGRGLITLAKPYASNTERSVPDYSLEITAGREIVHLTEWEKLPDDQGVYIIYIDKYGQGQTLSVSRSFNLKNKFRLDLESDANLKELLKPESDAFLIWIKCSDAQLLPKLQDDLIEFCKELRYDYNQKSKLLIKPKLPQEKRNPWNAMNW